MKKLLTFSLFLVLGSLQILEAQSELSQFSAPSSKQITIAMEDAIGGRSQMQNFVAKPRSAKSHPLFGNPPVNPVGFVSATSIPAGGLTQWSAVVADFNGDGHLDVAAPVKTSTASYAVSVVLSNGNGTFQSAQTTGNPNGVNGDQILVGDFNGDGKQDLIVVHATSPSTFEVWLGNGDGTFNVGTHLLNSVSPNFLVGGVLTDVNADGHLDLVFVDAPSPANVVTLLGNGDGTFQAPTTVALTGGSLSNVVFADFNGDGHLDFAATSSTNRQNVIYFGQPNGSYLAGVPLTNPDLAYHICNNSAGDLNGDGQPELVSANCGSAGAAGSLTVYLNNGNGTGTFQTGVYYAAATESSDHTEANIGPQAVTIADVNGDGKNDIVSSNYYGGDVTVLLGNGDGTLNVPTVGYSTGGYPKTSALVADFDGDGLADIIVPDYRFSFAYLPGYGDGTFRAALDYYSPVPGGFSAGGTTIASGDFNGDGYPDFVVGNVGYNNPSGGSGIGITVFLSNPDGSLNAGVNYGTGGSYQGVAVADIDGDGHLDIAAVNQSNNGVQIFHGAGDGTFSDGLFYSTGGTNASTIVAGDFNKDGHPDLAVANSNSNNVSVLMNDATGHFQAAVTYSTGGANQAIAAADVNGDGILDLVVTEFNPGVVAVLLGNGDGTFQLKPTSSFGFNYLGNLSLGDLDGDGKLDLAVAVADGVITPQGLAVAKGNGDGTFAAPVLYSTTLQNLNLNQPIPGDVKIVDLNGDGKLDLVYSNSFYGTVGVLYNTGTNSFGAAMFYDPVEFAAGSNVFALTLVDINQDGAVDVVAADNNYAGATVLLNASGTVSTLTSSLNPAVVSQSITFTATLAAKVRGVSAVPTGTVSFLDGGASIGTASLNGGVATFTTSSLAAATHVISVIYGGDSNFHSSTSTVLSEVITPTPDFAVAAAPSTMTVKAGVSAQYTITVTPSNGYNGTVSLTCVSTTLPSKAACSFNPASVAPGSTGYPTSTLTISTMAATASLVTPARPNSTSIGPTLWASLSGFGVFGLMLAGIGRKRNRAMGIVLGVLLVVMTLTLFGCGGSSSPSTGGNPGTPGTPTGNYTVTVTATGTGGNSPTHTMSVTLVVQ
jgi:Bacterial Ig-like domain (group 3)/FG-GAP-like repeat